MGEKRDANIIRKVQSKAEKTGGSSNSEVTLLEKLNYN
jgi:hypothetical protein